MVPLSSSLGVKSKSPMRIVSLLTDRNAKTMPSHYHPHYGMMMVDGWMVVKTVCPRSDGGWIVELRYEESFHLSRPIIVGSSVGCLDDVLWLFLGIDWVWHLIDNSTASFPLCELRGRRQKLPVLDFQSQSIGRCPSFYPSIQLANSLSRSDAQRIHCRRFWRNFTY